MAESCKAELVFKWEGKRPGKTNEPRGIEFFFYLWKVIYELIYFYLLVDLIVKRIKNNMYNHTYWSILKYKLVTNDELQSIYISLSKLLIALK